MKTNQDNTPKNKISSSESPQDLPKSSSGSSTDPKKSGRRRISMEYITDKNRRHITFSKRKAGIMKKAYELSTLTGTQLLLLVASETGHVYTFATQKLQPLITETDGKNLIQKCLSEPDVEETPQDNEPVYTKEEEEEEEKVVPPTRLASHSSNYEYQGDQNANLGGRPPTEQEYQRHLDQQQYNNPYNVTPPPQITRQDSQVNSDRINYDYIQHFLASQNQMSGQQQQQPPPQFQQQPTNTYPNPTQPNQFNQQQDYNFSGYNQTERSSPLPSLPPQFMLGSGQNSVSPNQQSQYVTNLQPSPSQNNQNSQLPPMNNIRRN